MTEELHPDVVRLITDLDREMADSLDLEKLVVQEFHPAAHPRDVQGRFIDPAVEFDLGESLRTRLFRWFRWMWGAAVIASAMLLVMHWLGLRIGW